MGKSYLLFIASLNLETDKKTGILKKVYNQKRILENYYDVVLVGLAHNGCVIVENENKEIVFGKPRKFVRNIVVKRLFDKYHFKKCFIRNGSLDYFFISMVKFINNQDCVIIDEIPTYPYDQELRYGLKNKLIAVQDKLCREKLSKYVDYIATYSNDDYIYNVPCINIRNGIDVFYTKCKNNKSTYDGNIKLVAVANVSFWHGYDRLIRGLSEYNGDCKFTFDIVGEGSELPALKQLVNDLNLNDTINFWGFKSGKELDDIYDESDIGVASLGIHRLGIDKVDALKVREYAAKGIPIICCENADVNDENWNYTIQAPEDDSNIDMSYVEKEYIKLIDNVNYLQDIRIFAEENFDINVTFKPIVNKFLQYE